MSAITHPLETIQELFAKNWQQGQSADKCDFGVTKHFENLFDTQEKLSKIPLLDVHSVHTLPHHSLVRFRCMVQDTELSQEVALFASTIASKPDGEEKFVCHRYSDGPQEDYAFGSDTSKDLMDLRNSYYCVSVPGETQWVKDQQRSKLETLETSLQGASLDDTAAPKVLPERYPFPGASHLAAVVKTHSSDVSIGVTDMVEVIGILGANDIVSSGDSFDMPGDSTDAPRIPTVHAILMRKVEDHGHPDLMLSGHPSKRDVEECNKEAKEIRKELIQYIAGVLHGDLLAAELVLLHLLARVHSRPSGAVLGKFSLNLRETVADSSVFRGLERVLSSILPKVHAIPLTLQNLNAHFFFPRGDEQLSSGMLQITRGTSLILDETALEEGTLVDKGLKNLKAISDVSLYQTLGYVFPFNNIDFQTDISLLIVSLGSSLVPVDCAITLQPERAGHDQQDSQPSEARLSSFRKYLSVLRLAEYKLSEDFAKEIESDFMEQRKSATAAGTKLMTPNELGFDISLARLVALSEGELTLTRHCWDHAVSLAKQIKTRQGKNEGDPASIGGSAGEP